MVPNFKELNIFPLGTCNSISKKQIFFLTILFPFSFSTLVFSASAALDRVLSHKQVAVFNVFLLFRFPKVFNFLSRPHPNYSPYLRGLAC